MHAYSVTIEVCLLLIVFDLAALFLLLTSFCVQKCDLKKNLIGDSVNVCELV